MPSTVASLLRAAGLETDGSVSWGGEVRSNMPGVYIVAASSDAEAIEGLYPHAPIGMARIQRWLAEVPGLTLDRRGGRGCGG
jgi:hypothetical protein